MTYANNSKELFELTIYCKVWTANWGLIAVAVKFSNCYLHKYISKDKQHTMINKIITEIYRKQIPNKIYNKLKRKLPYEEDVEDYQQEMYLILLETPEDKLIKLYNDKELDNYFARICINQLVNKNSNLHKLLQTKWYKQEMDNEAEGEFDSEPEIAISIE